MGDLGAYAATLAVPAALLALYAVFRWRYLAAIRRAIFAPGVGGSELAAAGFRPSEVPQLALDWIDATADRSAPPTELSHASMRTRQMRRRFLAAGAVFTAGATAVVWHGHRAEGGTAIALAYAASLPCLYAIVAFSSARLRDWVVAGLAWAAIGIVLLVGPLAVPWRIAIETLWSLIAYASFGVAVVALMALRTIRTVVVGFLPLLAVWLLGSAVFSAFVWLSSVNIAEGFTIRAVGGGVVAAGLGVAIAVREIRRGVRARSVSLLILACVAGLAIASTGARNVIFALMTGVAVHALLAVVVWCVFTHFLRLKARGVLPDEVLHYSFCWLALTALLPLYAASELTAVPWWLVPIGLYAATLTLLLRRWRRSMPEQPPRRLLLLRVFSRSSMRSRLVDLLDDSWRRIGTVDVVVGVDLAARTLSAAALESFLMGRVERQFLQTPADIERCLAALPEHLALDGRYALNELHCLPGVWRQVVSAVAREADVVLMDVRGFRRRNRGVSYELALITSCVPLERVVLLTDGTTDDEALTEVLRGSWSQLPHDSPNARASNPAIRLIRCSGKRLVDESVLLRRVFAAGLVGRARVSSDRALTASLRPGRHR